MALAKGLASLPLRLFHGCGGDLGTLLPHARFSALSADRLWARCSRWPFTVFSKLWVAAAVLREQPVVVGEPCLFHHHDSGRNPILLAPTRLPIRCYSTWRPGFLPYELTCSSIDALLLLLSTASDSLRSSCDCWPIRSVVNACPARRELRDCP